jgi:hypothetical protein
MELWSTDPDQRFLLKIADLTTEVACDESTFKLGVEGSKKRFIVHEGAPDVKIRAKLGKLPDDLRGRKLFDAGPVWQLYQCDGLYLFRFESLAFGSRPYKIAIFNEDFSNGEIYLDRNFFPPGQPVDPLWTPLDELIYTTLLAKGKGVEIHACGLIDAEGRGHLFVGKSGAGKTTMAKLWQDIPGVTILSDDRVILRKMGNKIWMYGTPWHGEGGMASATRNPLARIYFLQKGRNNELLPQKEAATHLIACGFPPFYNRDGMDFTLGFIGEVIREIPCYELRVVPDERVVEFLSGQIPVVN